MYDFDPKKDYYKILWVEESANKDEIKKTFKKLAVKHHPDKAGGNKEKFQEINEAYQVLSNDKKRQQYDMFKKWWGWFGGIWGGGFGWFQSGGFDVGWVDLWDVIWSVFGGWFGGGGSSRGASKWADIKHQLELTFEEAFLGTEKKIAYTRKNLVSWAERKTCPTCGGKWATVKQVQTPFWVMQSQVTCSTCSWTWSIFSKNWKDLSSYEIFEQKREEITIKIPAGINDWVYIKYSQSWHAGLAWDWDLYIKINILKSNIYERKWNNLYIKADVTIFDLVLWWSCNVHHPEGKLNIKIPKWTQINELIKISGKWFWESWIFHKKWNLYIDPQIHIPKRLSKKQEKLWKEIQKAK